MIDTLLAGAPDWALTHAAIMVVVIPMIASAIATVTFSGRLSWTIAFVAVLGALACSLIVLGQVREGDVPFVSYAIGGWVPPLGIQYLIDGLNAPILVLVSATALVCLLFAPFSVTAEIEKDKRSLFYATFLVAVAGLLGVAATGDAFNIFVFLEISSLSTYVLVAAGARRDRRALTAAFHYLILGTIGATFFVIGVGFLYMATGTLNLLDMARLFADDPDLSAATTVRAGYAFIVIGLGLKVALYPLHTWLPDAYARAPSLVSTFIAATSTKVALYALIRFQFAVFEPTQSFQALSLAWLIGPLAAAGLVIAAVQAVMQGNARRVLAYSSVSQVGYMLLGVALATYAGVAAGVLHLMTHALMKAALFMALGLVAARMDARRVTDLAGMARLMPVTAACFTIGGLSLIGVPLTAGFVSKFALFQAAAAAGAWWAVAAIAVGSLLAFVYVGRLLEVIYMREPTAECRAALSGKSTPILALSVLVFVAAANVGLGVDARFIESLAQGAASAVGLSPGGAS